MGIAFHAAADLGNNGGGSGHSASYTVGSGVDRILWVTFEGDSIGGADDITGVTYGGVAMTLRAKNTTGSGVNRILYLYYLLNPASGANNVVITTSGSHYILAQAADYTGAKQSASGAVNTGRNVGTDLTLSVTTVEDNSWVILVGPASFGTGFSAGTGSTQRATEGAFTTNAIFDSNAAITPAGSHSMTITTSGPSDFTGIIASFAPSVAASGNSVDLGAGSIDTTGSALTVTKTDNKAVTLGAGGAHTTGQTPTVHVTDPKSVTLGAGGAHTTGQQPTVTVSAARTITIDAGTVSTVGQQLDVSKTDNKIVTLGAGGAHTRGQTLSVVAGANIAVTLGNGHMKTVGKQIRVTNSPVTDAPLKGRGRRRHPGVRGVA